MQDFYIADPRIVGELMYADNFYIALYDEERRAINLPFYVDEVDADLPDPNVWEPIGIGRRAPGSPRTCSGRAKPMLLSTEDGAAS